MKTEQNPALEALATMARASQETFSTYLRYAPSTPTKEIIDERIAYARRAMELHKRTHDIMERTRRSLEPYRRADHERVMEIYTTVRRLRERRVPRRVFQQYDPRSLWSIA